MKTDPSKISRYTVTVYIMVSQHFPYDTSCSKPLQNYMVFNDTDGVYTFAFEAEKNVSLCQYYDYVGVWTLIML